MITLDPTILILMLITLTTSTVAGVFGFGGGMLLIAALPGFLPAAALIPVHSAIQLLSNTSRAALSWRDIHWQFAAQHALGSLIGIGLVALALFNIALTYIPLMIGLYIMLNTWSGQFQRLVGKLDSFYMIGAVQTGLGLMVGAPGPLPLPLLLRRLNDQHQIVCTMAIFMTTGHILKLIIFVAAGFAFSDYWLEILMMGAAAIGGSFLGTHWRQKIDATQFEWVVKLLLTVLALLAIFRALSELST